MFIDLPVCPTHALLQFIHVSLHIPNFCTVLSKLLVVFVVLYATFMHVFKKFNCCAQVVACVCEGGPFLLLFIYIPTVTFSFLLMVDLTFLFFRHCFSYCSFKLFLSFRVHYVVHVTDLECNCFLFSWMARLDVYYSLCCCGLLININCDVVLCTVCVSLISRLFDYSFLVS